MKKRHIITTSLVGLGLALNLASWAHADDASAQVDASSDQSQSLDERVGALEQRLALLSPVSGTPTAFQGSPTAAFASVNRGIGFVSSDGNYGIKFGGTLQEDSRNYFDGGLNTDNNGKDVVALPNSEFVLARARLLVDAFLGPRVHLRYQEDFSNNGANSGSPAYTTAPTNGGSGAELVDAYGELRLLPWTLLRVGQFRPGLDIERWRQTPAADWIQFGYTAGLVVDRSQGAQIEIADPSQIFYLNGGVFDGDTDTGNPVVTTYNSDKDAIARLFVQPFNKLSGQSLGNLGFGVAASGGNHSGDPAPTYKSLGQLTIVNTPAADTALKGDITPYAEGAGYRVVPQAYWFLDQFSLLSEYVHESQGYLLTNTGVVDHTVSEAWQVQGGWVITGEHTSYNGLKLDKNSYSWGALELVARVQGANYDESGFAPLENNETSVKSLSSWSLGLNYIPVNDVKFLLDWDQTSFNDGGQNDVYGTKISTVLADRATEEVLQGRVQFAF